MSTDPVSSPAWYPVKLEPRGEETLWFHLPGEGFLDPFFEETVRRHRRSAPSAHLPLECLRGASPDVPDPRAIFFHASRCGSTLVMQLLSRVPGCRCISEAPVLDELLHSAAIEDDLLKGLIRSFGKPDENRAAPVLFLKTDSWHLPHLDRIRRVFPETPCYFIYRDPAEILRSHRRERGSQMVPQLVDPWRFDIDPATVNFSNPDAYAERVLAAIFRQAVTAAESGEIIPIAYSQLPDLIWDRLGHDLGLGGTVWDAAKERAKQHSKDPSRSLEDPREEQALIVKDQALLADFQRLEELRIQGVGLGREQMPS